MVGAALDSPGRLWLTQINDRRLTVSPSENDGNQFSPAIAVTPVPEAITADAENRPKIAIGEDGIVHANWTQKPGGRMTDFIRYTLAPCRLSGVDKSRGTTKFPSNQWLDGLTTRHDHISKHRS